MAKAPPSAKRDRIKAFTPALVDYTNDVVYGDLWERKALSKRDRSLITVAALVATYRPEQLESHLTRAIANGVTQEEITEVITHLAFYAGWPAAMSAAQVAYTVLVEGRQGGMTMANEVVVGFIGLGTMGGKMATNLHKAGYKVVVHDLHRQSASHHLQAGAEWADTPRALAEKSDVIFTSLPEPADVEARLARSRWPDRRRQKGRGLFRSVDQLAKRGEKNSRRPLPPRARTCSMRR